MGVGSVGSGSGVLVASTAVAVAGGSVGAAWETAVSWGTAVSVQPMRRKREASSKKKKTAVVLCGVIID
jgi:hypothetical protein